MNTEHEADGQRRGDQLLGALEALLIVGDRPLPTTELATALGVPRDAVEEGLERLRRELDGSSSGRRHGIELRLTAAGWQYAARPEFDGVLQAFANSQEPVKLSQPALETLAIVAYRQPIARAQIAAIRAVNVDSVVHTLQDRGLIEEAFRDPDTGAAMFQTTPLLLEQLGLSTLEELPPLSPLLPGADDLEEIDHE